jgi:tripartite-type tricarboxylate transporter receptor subunit TctC
VNRRELITLVGGMAVVPLAARAQTYPSKPIRFIVPFPAGGSTDAAARVIQPQLEKSLGQTVVIENRAGAGAVIGLEAIARNAPDGYTFGIAPAGAMSVNPAMQVKMPFDVRKDLAAISNLAETPFILGAASTLKLVRWAT